MKRFPRYKQLDDMDCGPTCLRMVLKYYGKEFSAQNLRKRCYIDRTGVNLNGISEAAESVGLRTLAVQIPLIGNGDEADLKGAPLPAIVHWDQKHFVVVHKISSSRVHVVDPAVGRLSFSYKDFNRHFCSEGNLGVALLLETTPMFFQQESEKEKKHGFGFLFQYLRPYSKLIVQLIIGLFLGVAIQLIFPFLTQSLVDIGINTNNLNFIYLVLAGQLMLFFSQTIVRFIQSWIMLHISVRINVSLLADFLLKLMKLPLGFFDSKNTGDLLQRIGDHQRIELFITESILNLFLAFLNLFVFGLVLAIYSIPIFLIFIFSSIIYLLWIYVFMKKRREVDYDTFAKLADNQDAILEIIQGMSEIKLQGSQLKRRWKWSKIQAKLFRFQMKSLAITQYQDAGTLSISQLKDIIITFLSAKAVLDGTMTLGTMLAIQYIIGQLNAPLQQLSSFIRAGQDASISLERLSEIHDREEEEVPDSNKVLHIPDEDIHIKNLSFSYSALSDLVLEGINIRIPRGKTTAIVGTSGSGKTTLIKLLLGFYPPSSGKITIGTTPLENIHQKQWRSACGVVMQEGYIFGDSIINNIAESDETTDIPKAVKAAELANILDFFERLPLGMNTMVGHKGKALSQGQKQRLLIARVIYKNPDFLFFDEATNALDAKNERIIVENLDAFFNEKTVVVVAHRLSTVKNADQIIVLEQGNVVETGNHETLVTQKGHYYTLVKNQLELGS